MNHKKRQAILGCILISISVLLLIWSPLPTQAGPNLPPRKPPSAAQPPDDDKGDEPVGAHIVLHVLSAPAGVWTIVQWQDSGGSWHDIDGWQGTLDEGDQKMWWLAPDLFGKGPFHWLVYQSPSGDNLLATSESFCLPDSEGEKLQIEVSLLEWLPQDSQISSKPLTQVKE